MRGEGKAGRCSWVVFVKLDWIPLIVAALRSWDETCSCSG